MIYPIIAYGDPVLKKKATDITEFDDSLSQLVSDMFDTMYNASGVGLAGPQIGKSLRIFVVDGTPMLEVNENDEKPKETFKKVFINAQILDETGNKWGFEEGCLSIPDIRGEVQRHQTLTIKYQDEKGNWFEEEYDGIKARIIQHEYDHIEGVLFTDYASPMKKRRLKGRLEKISKGDIRVDYSMRFPNKKGR